MHMNFHLAFEKEGVPQDKRETIFRYGKSERNAPMFVSDLIGGAVPCRTSPLTVS